MNKILLISAIILSIILSTKIVSAQEADSTAHQFFRNQYGLLVDLQPLEPESWNGIISFRSKDKTYRLWLDNRVYIDGAYFFDNNTYNAIGNGLTVRRARFAVKATLHNNWYGEIDLDFAGSEVEMKDMIIGYNFSLNKDGFLKNVKIKAGNFKETFSMEYTTTSRYLTFIERSLTKTFVPGRTLGLQTQMNSNRFFLGAGVSFNDVGDSEVTAWSKDNNKKRGMDEGYSVTGRLVGYPIINDNSVLHIGVAASYRTPKTSWEISDGYRYSTRSLTSINRKKYLDTDDISNVESLRLIGFELAGAYKNFMFQSEYMMQRVSGTSLNKSGQNAANFDGAYIQAAWLIFGGHYRYNTAEAEFTQISRGQTWGDIELAVRYDYISLNDFDAKVYGGGANGFTIGTNYYVNSNVKIMLNYSLLDHDRYANGKGKLYTGYDSNGNLTKDWSKIDTSEGAPGEKFGFVALRLEVDF
ncbi:MAG: porin [Bacteroidetes bacterium]|nr:MAG: porin [Bacteroidota bacterium]